MKTKVKKAEKDKQRYEYRHAWVIAKTAVIREKPDVNSKVTDVLKFGQSLSIGSTITQNGRMFVYYHNRKNNGWISCAAISSHLVEPYFRLEFFNKEEKRVPVSDRYKGNVTGFVMPGESVDMIAKVGKWCLTSKGWSKFEWFEKRRNVFDMVCINLVYVSVMEEAVKEYKSNVHKILKCREYLTDEGFIMAVGKIEGIASWFLEDEYGVAGVTRYGYLNEDCGIDKEWLKKILDERDALCRAKGVKKYRDIVRGYQKPGRPAQKR